MLREFEARSAAAAATAAARSAYAVAAAAARSAAAAPPAGHAAAAAVEDAADAAVAAAVEDAAAAAAEGAADVALAAVAERDALRHDHAVAARNDAAQADDDGDDAAAAQANPARLDKADARMEIPSEMVLWATLGLRSDSPAAAWRAYREAEASLRRAAPRPRTFESDASAPLRLIGGPAAPPTRVFVDWPHSAFDVSGYNYAAIESFISFAPTLSIFEGWIVAPELAKTFRYSNALSYTQFERYGKLGVNFTMGVVHAGTPLFQGHAPKLDVPGQRWWEKHRRKVAPRWRDAMTFFMRDDEDVVPSPALTLFLRLAKLWMRGGWVVDMTVLALAPLPAKARGFAIGDGGCAGRDAGAAWGARGGYHRRAPPPMVLGFTQRGDGVVACVLRLFDKCGEDVHCADQIGLHPLPHFEKCAADDGDFENALDGAVEWLGCDADAAQSTHKRPPAEATGDGESRLADLRAGALSGGGNKRFVWLGLAATAGKWRPPARASALGAAFAAAPRFELADAKCAAWVAAERARNRTWCQRALPALAGPSSRGEAKDADLRRLAHGSCSPSIVLPAAQKGASSYLFSLLAAHPQALRPLRGSQYKEPGAYINKVYYREGLRGRGSRFAFAREGEGLVSLDGTVTYASDSRLPAMRHVRDHPAAVAIFALREPVDRSFSDYRFCYKPFFAGLPWGWDHEISQIIPHYDQCYNATLTGDVDAGLDAYYGMSCTKQLIRLADPFGLFRKSLYVYMVLHYQNVYGKDRVAAVTSEQLLIDPAGVARRVAKFAGLCDFDFEALKPVHVTPDRLKPEHYWSEEVYDTARKWFAPYNAKLFEALGTTEAEMGWGVKRPKNFRDTALYPPWLGELHKSIPGRPLRPYE